MDISLALSPPDMWADPDTERAWIAAAQRDPAAFAPLYTLYRTRIYHYLRVRLSTDADAADLTHQVFLHAMIALKTDSCNEVPQGICSQLEIKRDKQYSK